MTAKRALERLRCSHLIELRRNGGNGLIDLAGMARSHKDRVVTRDGSKDPFGSRSIELARHQTGRSGVV